MMVHGVAAAQWLALAWYCCVTAVFAGESDTAPQQIHLALAGRDGAGWPAPGAPTGMRFAWFTQKLPKGGSPSSVKYGTTPGALLQRASAARQPVQYLADSGYHHRVDVLDLAPGTTYFYAVGSDEGGWSDTWSFKTKARDAQEVTLAAFGDLGYEDSNKRPTRINAFDMVKNWSASVTRGRLEALKDDIDLVWHLGDIGYADDAFAHHPFSFVYEDVYNGFMNWMQNVSATVPYMVSVGNHESECHSLPCLVSSSGLALRNFTAYNNRWHMPSGESGGRDGSAMWFSWDYGPIHFVSIDSETDWPGAALRDTGDAHIPWLKAGHFGADGEYLRWLESDLRAASEARAQSIANGGSGPRWIVAGGHRPFGEIQGAHTDLFTKYGVDLYLAGHGHSYSRASPYKGTLYIMAGGAGCDEMSYSARWTGVTCVPGSKLDECRKNWAVPDGFQVQTSKRYALGLLKADRTRLKWQLIDSESGGVIDETTLSADSKRDGAGDAVAGTDDAADEAEEMWV